VPLIQSSSKKARSKNIKELVRSYKKKGSIGTSKPEGMKQAIAQAVAISYSIKRKNRGK